MKDRPYCIVLLLLTLLPFSTCAQRGPVGMIDMGYSLEGDMANSKVARRAWDHVHTIATLQGIVNRKAPRLYIFLVNNGENIDRYWWDKYRKPGKWLEKRDTVVYQNIVDVILAYRSDIKGVVLYDPLVAATSNVASAVAGAEDLLAVRYDTDQESLYSRLVLNGPRLPVKRWLLNKDGTALFTGKGVIPGTSRPSSGSAKNDAYLWFLENYMKKGKCNTNYGAYYIDQHWMKNPTATVLNHHTLSNHDFFVSRNAFFFDLSPWEDEAATDDLAQAPGLDRRTLQELLLTAYKNNGGEKMCYLGGFPPWIYKYTRHAGGKHEDVATEWEYSRVISAYNAFKDADAIGFGALANASFWQHYPLKEQYKQNWVTPEDLKRRGYLTSDGKVDLKGRDFLIYYVGDYDAASWVYQTIPKIWDSPKRGQIPLMWCISPVLQERVPMALEYQRETATAMDYFAAADNGAGYLMPGMLQAPRPISGLPDGMDTWAAHNRKYYKKWDLTITGFVIDGLAPALNKKGLDAYATFSPNGIVPQKVPLTALHGNMPVLRSDYDINSDNPQEAAALILQRISERPVPFHWFRSILKTPELYVEVTNELKRRKPSVELLDAPAFFALYRIWLQENPDAAAGNIEMKNPLYSK